MDKILAVTLLLGLPVVAVIAAAWMSVTKTRCKYKMSSEIINSGIDKDIAKMLLNARDTKKKSSLSFGVLRISLMLIFLGLGAIVSSRIGMSALYFVYLVMGMAIGGGLGLLISFIIEWLFFKRQADTHADNAAE